MGASYSRIERKNVLLQAIIAVQTSPNPQNYWMTKYSLKFQKVFHNSLNLNKSYKFTHPHMELFEKYFVNSMEVLRKLSTNCNIITSDLEEARSFYENVFTKF